MLSILLGDPNHLTDPNDNFGEGQAAFLFGRYRSLHRKPKRANEREESFILFGDEILGLPGKCNWFFHERLGGEKGVARSAGILPRGRDRSEVRAGGNVPHIIS